MALLELRDVVAGYHRRAVVLGVSLDVDAGELVALVGRNGAGKTTLLRAAAGIVRPTAGRVSVAGRDVARLPAREAALLVAGVAQDDVVDAPFRVRDVVALGRLARLSPFRGEDAADRASIDAALVATDLVGLSSRLVPTLSGGERRRVALARCLAQDAPLLLLDEPTAHLDVGQEARVFDVVRRWTRERGRAAVAAMHDLNLAGAYADRVVLLEEGRVVADGPPREVLSAKRLSEVFRTPLRVVDDPVRGVPLVVPGAGS